jgi:hypothetical protein
MAKKKTTTTTRKARKPSKAQQPETVGQAMRWDRVKTRYLQAGLCHKCAAQAAWGHQIGFALSHPPCALCAPIAATFPTDTAGDWRKLAPAQQMTPDAVARLREAAE